MVTVEQLKLWNQAEHEGKTMQEAAKMTGLSMATISRFRAMKKNGEYASYMMKLQNKDPAFLKKKFEAITEARKNGNGPHAIIHLPRERPHSPNSHAGGSQFTAKQVDKQLQMIVHLREQGMILKDIARAVKLPPGTVSYRLYTQAPKLKGVKSGRPRKSKRSKGAELNGNASDSPNSTTPVKKDILIGYALAKTEEYVRFLSERTGLSEDTLKQRLPELLGRNSLR